MAKGSSLKNIMVLFDAKAIVVEEVYRYSLKPRPSLLKNIIALFNAKTIVVEVYWNDSTPNPSSLKNSIGTI